MIFTPFLFLLFPIITLLLLAPHQTTAICTHKVFCIGTILEVVQWNQIFKDDKEFVDWVIKQDIGEAEFLSRWDKIPTTSYTNKTLISNFITENMLPPGSDLESVEPSDFNPTPAFLDRLTNKELRLFAQDLHYRWKSLLRHRKSNLISNTSSLIPVPHPFVVAGGRFREWYNWDSYWINKGLLVSDMPTTSKQMIDNFLFVIDQYGFLPNGGRIYYLNRSQPPFTATMVWEYYQRYGNFGSQSDLKQAFDILVKEYDYYWMTSQHLITLSDSYGTTHQLNRYNVNSTISPRPESWFKDWEIAEEMGSESEKVNFYQQIATGAESGWDFSTRWFQDYTNLNTIETNHIIPVDLNSILYKMEVSMAQIANVLNNQKEYLRFNKAMQARQTAIAKFLYNSTYNTWFDYDFITKQQRIMIPSSSSSVGTTKEPLQYISSFVPVWAGASHLPTKQSNQILRQFVQKNIGPGGLPTSTRQSTEQWDWNNVWAPLQYFISAGLHESSSQQSPEDDEELFNVVNTWISTTYCGWKNTPEKLMYEKYDASQRGKHGGGGEYEVQNGFGWTNGLVLHYLEQYGNNITLLDC